MCADLAAEQDELDGFVACLDEPGWNIQTPAEGWTIKDQIRHLAYYEERARLAASDPEFLNNRCPSPSLCRTSGTGTKTGAFIETKYLINETKKGATHGSKRQSCNYYRCQ